MFNWYFELWENALNSDLALLHMAILGGATLGVLVMIIGIIAPTIKKHAGNADMKRRGEAFEESVLSSLKKYLGVIAIPNVLMQYNNNPGNPDTTEADMVFVNNKGIFCVECKSHKGWELTTVEGSLSHEDWNVYGQTFGSMRNPFTQNENHISVLKRHLTDAGFSIPQIHNIVVINNGFRFFYWGKIVEKTDFFPMLNEGKALISLASASGMKSFNKALQSMPSVLSAEEVCALNEYIATLSGNKTQLKEHAKRVAEKHI